MTLPPKFLRNLSPFFYLCHHCPRLNHHNLSPRLMQMPPVPTNSPLATFPAPKFFPTM